VFFFVFFFFVSFVCVVIFCLYFLLFCFSFVLFFCRWEPCHGDGGSPIGHQRGKPPHGPASTPRISRKVDTSGPTGFAVNEVQSGDTVPGTTCTMWPEDPGGLVCPQEALQMKIGQQDR